MLRCLLPSCTGTLQWQIIWTLAFPTLVPERIFTEEHEPVWQLLAWLSLKKNHRVRGRSTNKSVAPVTKLSPISVSVEQSIRDYGMSSDAATSSTTDMADFAWKQSVGYGEITPSAVLAILYWLRQAQLCSPCVRLPKRVCVVDLGSGNGNVLVAASLALPVATAIGLEILPHLHQQALQNLEDWKHANNFISDVNWDLRCADFTIKKHWTQQADLVFIHATVFEDGLLETLNNLCRACREGTMFCLISRSLKEEDGVRTVAEFQLDMSWGIATVYLQQRITG